MRTRTPVGRHVATPHAWAIGGLALCVGAVIQAVLLVSPVRFAYPAASVGIALETGITLLALVCGYLVLGRFGPGLRLDRLFLSPALATLAASSLLLVVADGVQHDMRLQVPLYTGALAGATLLVLAALVPARSPRVPHWAAAGVLATWSLVVAASYGVARLTLDAPRTLVDMAELDSGRPRLEGPPEILLPPLAGTALSGLAALGFARRARRHDDELVLWLVPGAVCIAFAYVGYFLFPPAPASWVHVGDIFRVLFCVAVLVGVARWIRGYWRDLAGTAVAEERRRIARELHDGLAQELAVIRRRRPWLARQREAAEAREIIEATERALDESRWAIDGLSRPREEPLDRALAREAQQLTAGAGVQVSLNLARGVELEQEVQENLVRIAREAVANAARHGGAATILVELAPGSPLHLRVVDDGVGFDPACGVPGGGHGVPSMRERAAAIGAHLTLRSRPGQGTEILVRLP